MKRGIVICCLCVVLLNGKLAAQFTYKIKADSVKITNDNCNAELILENSTKNINGFLFNYGNGRTRFRNTDSLYQPLENQRLSTGNSPSFYSETLSGGTLRFLNGSNDMLADGSDPGSSLFNYVKFRSQTSRGAGLQLVPSANGINYPYVFDFNATTDGNNSFKIFGDGVNHYHVLSSSGPASPWPLAIQMSTIGDPGNRAEDVIRINTDRSIQLPQLGSGYLVTDASGKISVSPGSNSSNLWNGYGNAFSAGVQNAGIASIIGFQNDGTAYSFSSTALAGWLGINAGGETLQSVTNRGNVTSNSIISNSFITANDFSTATDASFRKTFVDRVAGQTNVAYDGYFTWYTSHNNSLHKAGFLMQLRASDVGEGGENAIMTITGNGNTGIGVATPASKLDVNGNITVRPASVSWNEGIAFSMPTTNTWGGVRWRRERANSDGNWYFGYTALDATDDLVFGAENGSTQVDNILRLTKAGNVGIGIATPANKLTVAGSIQSTSGNIFATNGQFVSQLSTNEGGAIRLDNFLKTGATANEWVVYNMKAPAYDNALEFWRYYADGSGGSPVFKMFDNGSSQATGNFSAVGSIFSSQGVSVATEGTGNDPYGPIAVTRPANGNSYTYLGMTRSGQIGWASGITTGNDYFIAAGYNNALTGTPKFRLSSSSSEGYIDENRIWHSGNFNPGFLMNNNQLLYTTSDWAYFQNNLQGQHPSTLHDGVAIGWNYDGGSAQAYYVNTYGASSSDSDWVGQTVFAVDDRNTNTITKNFWIDADGDIWARKNVYASGGVIVTSDINSKENITDIQPTLNKLLKLRTIQFNYKAEKKPGNLHTGLIAQEVEQAFPLLVSTPVAAKKNDTPYKGVDYIGVVTVLVKALQEENQKVEALNEQVSQLRTELNSIKNK